MISLPLAPLFLGPVELMLVGAVILVLVFGSRASDIAREAGSAAGKVRNTRRTAEREIDDIRGDLEEEVEAVEEDLEAVEEDLEAVEEDLEPVIDDTESQERDTDENTDNTGNSP